VLLSWLHEYFLPYFLFVFASILLPLALPMTTTYMQSNRVCPMLYTTVLCDDSCCTFTLDYWVGRLHEIRRIEHYE